MNYFIITGASKGFGRAVASSLLRSADNFVISLSRTDPKFQYNNSFFVRCDFSMSLNISDALERVRESIGLDIESIHLINNAGVTVPIGTIDTCSANDIISSFNVNAITPFLVSSWFVKSFSSIRIKKSIFNITSGAGKNAYHGWLCYCASKASLDMLTTGLKIESPEFTVVGYDPGVIDTEMQTILRQQESSNFNAVDKFRSFKNDGRLLSPEAAAERFLEQFLKQYI